MKEGNIIRENINMTQSKKRAYCYACYADFEYDWKAWARHQIENKKDKGHKKNQVFAAKILTNVRALNAKKDLPGRTPLTDEQKEAKTSTIRPTSGMFKIVRTYCPQCHVLDIKKLEVEFIEDMHTWKHNDNFVVLCETHYAR